MRLRMIPVIFKEGIVASLTGGFYFDSSQTHFANVIHVYVWIILFVIPLVLYMISVNSHITALLYGFSIGSFVLIVKLVIWRLHDLLDKSDPVDNSQKASKENLKKQPSTKHQTGVHEDDQEHFHDINDIENKCRRIGIAGIELADLRDSTLNHACRFTDSEMNVGSPIQNTHILNDKGICKYKSLKNNLEPDLAFSESFTNSITFPVSSFQLGPSTSRLNYVTIEQSPNCSNRDSMVPGLSVVEEKQSMENNKLNSSNSNCALFSNNSNQIYKSETITSGPLKSTISSTSAETKNTDFTHNLNARTVKPIYVNTPLKSFSGRSCQRAPVRRQFSETAVKNAFEVQRLVTFYDQTDRIPGLQFDHFVPEITSPITGELSVDKSSRPITSISGRFLVRSSSVRTEIEHCKRILNQLKWDVSQLPPIPVTRFTPSMKDLDTLDLNPKVLQSAPLSFVRSRSQLRRRALFVDRDQNKRTITYLTASDRNSIPYSTELSLSETILFWRQCFGNINFDRSARRRHQQADMIAFNEIPLSNMNLRPRRLPRGWRSHSLHYDPAAMKSFTLYPRQVVRGPGTTVCLQRQQSAGSTSSAVVNSSSLEYGTPVKKTIQFSVSDSHDSTESDTVEAITLDNQQVQNDRDNIPVDAEHLTSKWPTSSSNVLDEVQPSTQSHDLNEKVDEYVEKKVKDIEITSLCNYLSNDGFAVDLQTPTTHPLDKSSLNKIANDHYSVESNKSLLTKTRGCNRLTRQAGFRRRPVMASGSYGQSKGVTSLKNEKVASSSDNHLQPEVTQEIKRSDVDSNLRTSSSVSKPISTNPISVDQAVDNLLAHLMGVKSLADTGLTRQQCLFQLRGNGNTEDSENAEWDILYAVTEAATDNATVIPEPTETITTNIATITTTAATSQTDGQPAQLRSASPETKNRDGTYQDDAFNNLDEDSWDLQEISIKARFQSTNENQEVDDEIHTQEAVANRSNDSGSDGNGGNNSSSNSLLWFFRKGFRPSKLQQQQQQQNRPLSTAPIYTISLSPCFPFTFRFHLNRLELGYIFDKSFTIMEIILCSILAALVSIIGYYTLRTASFQNYGPLACFTIAGCHYSLMKSVQPDPASPKHGFNRLIVFTRSFFFCSFASIYLLANYLYQPQKSVPFSGEMSSIEHTGELRFESITTIYQSTRQMLPLDIGETSNELTTEKINWRVPNFYHLSQSSKMIVEPSSSPSTIKFYGVNLSVDRLTCLVKYSSIYVLLIFPILFCLGLMPQINTVLIYALEQLDIHIFGASGTTGLFSVILSIFRTFIVIGLTFVPCYYAVEKSDPQCMLFSIFWGIQIALCFLLSRLPSNTILYETLFPSERRIYYWYRIRMFFYNAWHKITVKCNLIFRSKERKEKKKTHRSQLTSIDKSNWWRRLPLLFPNLRMKSTNASFKKTDENVEEFLLSRLTHTKECVDVESGVPVQSNSLPCRLISRDNLTQSTSTPAIKYNFEAPSTIVVSSSWIESQDVNNSENKKFSTLDKINNNTNNGDNNSNDDNNNRTNTLPSFVIDQNLSASVNTLTISKDNSRVTTEQYQTTDSKTKQSQFKNDDPLPNLIRISLLARFENDLLSCILWFILAFLIHLTITIINTTIDSTDFHSYYYCYILNWISVVLGFLLHYVWPNFRKPYPWLLLVKPVVEPDLHGRIIRWEVAYFWLCWLERNVFLPVITMCMVTQSFDSIVVKFGPLLSTFIIIVCSMKMLRNGFCCAKQTYLSLFFTNLLFSFDFYNFKEAFPINYFFVSLLVSKFIELFRKLHFIYVYLAPFNIIWGSVAHAVVQLGSIPHSVFLFANCIFSTILSAPLEPFMASAIFITSYVRPISFWETNHRTQRIETTNMPIAAQLKGISKHQVSGNLDGIFYEHLTRKLQRTLAGDLQLGRIGGLTVQHGDVFILSTDDLNLLIHIIEVGNGFVTYQLRGLEFIGTLCHASESEALRSDPHKSKRFCCCHSKTIHGMLSFNTAVRLRCMTWQFAYTPYIVEGYEVTDHSAGLTFQLTDLRKVLISRFVHCIIYFVCKLPNLSSRLTQLTPCLDSNRFSSPDYFDLDPVFFKAIDDDFDEDVSGVTKQRFIQIYSDWIAYCLKKQSGNSSVPCGPDSPVVSLCLALSLLGRRCMGGQQSSKPILDQFLHGVHQVFAGDINLVPRDDWVLVDLDLLQTVVTPSVRIALKLYQDTFTWSSGNTHNELYKKIVYTEKNVVICPETDPKWRFAVLNDADCLFSFRWVSGRTSVDVYRIVQLTKRRLEFRAIKLNPECVRGLWAGQQREQIFLRNNNEERGSIQSANPVLRNLVNSSCDPPIGYPIYVSPLITSFAGDNDDYINVSGGELSFVNILLRIRDCWRRFRQLCGCKKEKCDGQIDSAINPSLFTRSNTSQQLKTNVPSTTSNKSNAQLTLSTHPSTSNDNDNLGKWSSKQLDCNQETTLIALIHQQNDLDNIAGGILSTSTNRFRENHHFDHICYSIEQLYKNSQQVIIIDACQILSGHLNKLQWPLKGWYLRSLTYSACRSSVYSGLGAYRIHRWTPNNPDPNSRSFCHRTIALLAFPEGPPLLDGYYVAIWEDKGLIEVKDSDKDINTTNNNNINNDNNNNNNNNENNNNNSHDQFLMNCLFTNRN